MAVAERPLTRSDQSYLARLLAQAETQYWDFPDQKLLAPTGTPLTRQVEDALFALVLRGITVPRPADVRDYLVQYPNIIDLLVPVALSASRRFGPATELSLELHRDPEIDDEYLTLYVRQPNCDKDILDDIEDLSAEHEGELVGRSGWFLVTTDFRPPGR